MQNRVIWADEQKGFVIILVLMSHLPFIPIPLNNALFSLHIPFFIFFAGWWSSQHVSRTKLSACLKQNFSGLIIPYYCFWIISWIFWLGKSHALNRPIEWYKPVIGLFYGIDSMGHYLDNNSPLWFLTFFFSLKVSIYFMQHLKHPFLFSIILSSAGFLFLEYSPFRLPWNFDIALCALPIFFGARFLKGIDPKFKPDLSSSLVSLTGLILIILASYYGVYDRFDWNGGFLNPWYIMYSLGFLGSLLITGIGFPHFIGVHLRWIGKNSLMLFCLHLMPYTIFAALWMFTFKSPLEPSNIPYLVFQFLWPILAILFLAPFAKPINNILNLNRKIWRLTLKND